jgi:hypothetical protein
MNDPFFDGWNKWVICGSRSIRNPYLVAQCLDEIWATTEHGALMPVIITGGAGGVDTFAHKWAMAGGFPTQVMRADWDKHGKRAGFVRNVAMLDEAGAGGYVIAIWDGESRGTAHTITEARKRGMRVTIFRTEGP